MKRLIIFFLVCFLTNACNIKLDGRPGVSQNISDSKNRKVFEGEYNVIYESANDETFTINIIEAWVEKKWRFTKFNYSKSNIQAGYQLCIKVDKESVTGLNNEWFIERKGKESIGRIGEDIIWISDTNKPDSATYFIFEGRPNYKPKENQLLGSLKFEKVSE